MKILAALALLLAATPGSALEDLPAGGGEPGKVYRDFMAATEARDWRTLHRVTTNKMFALLPEMLGGPTEPLPRDVEILVRGQQDGDRAEIEVELQRRQGSTTTSSTSRALLLRHGGVWRVASSETEEPVPPLSFEAAETMRRMRELGGALDARRFMGTGPFPRTGTAKEVAALVAPADGPPLPTTDAWDNPFAYRYVTADDVYVLVSHGQGGAPEATLYDASGIPKPAAAGATTDPKADLIMASFRRFVRYPQGAVTE
jgi:hypothetical protein